MTSDLAALAIEGRVVPSSCGRKVLLLETRDSDLGGQGGTVNVCSSLMPCSHSVQHLHASQRK